ncbi:putative pyrroloquinoline-quinone binding quinoprotein [Krasilnikovia cinnamomea]|uniref:Putative pyrroloquinoline-quinone binding quinoprotein n=1 Tax=Krasilnikovia cinnamomea TaxID=349313 RepID=A0A4Q7ZKN8_9ACTN|nr:putative pyrroloquinoline-quinone binding quinoprotein [Krasilnikovia cinnamomea]
MTYRDKFLKRIAGVAVLGVVLAVAPTPAEAISSNSQPVPSFNGTVWALAYSGSTLYVGGDFTAAVVRGKTIKRNKLAAVNATTGALLSWAPSANGRVKAIAVSGSSVYVAGNFSAISGQKRDSLARIDGSSGAVSSTFKHSISGSPYAAAAANGRLYLGGTFSAIDGQPRGRLAAFNLSTGALDGAWRPSADDQVEAITAAGTRVYVGGRFHRVNGASGYDRLVALDPSRGSIVTGFKPRPSVITYGITVTSAGVFSAHGGRGGTVNAYTTSGSKRWTATFDGDGQAVVALGGAIYVGGHFDHACRTSRTGSQGTCLDGAVDRVKLAALSPSDGRLLGWTANLNGIEGVLTMAGSAGLGRLAAGGTFTTVNGANQKRLAQFG